MSQPVREAREKLEADGTPPTSAARVIRFTTCARKERRQAGSEADALADCVEDGFLGNGSHAAAHLRVDDDPHDADDDHPEELVAEGRARGDVEDDVADVDEAADRSRGCRARSGRSSRAAAFLLQRPLRSAALSASFASSW
jgi:hypothetical protein